jgi:ubiquinone/menaquinone biosynthesis C-methylase UbiE
MREEVIRHAARNWQLDFSNVCDLACGDGRITSFLLAFGLAVNVEGVDHARDSCLDYEKKTGRPCLNLKFEDIAAGSFPQRKYSLVICSFGLHFLDPDLIPGFLRGLTRYTSTFLLIGPGWQKPIPLDHWAKVEEYVASNGTPGRLFRRKTWMA